MSCGAATTPTEPDLAVRLLGPVEVEAGGQRTSFAGAKQRAIVALLGLDAGRVVSADRLVDAVWGDDVPPGVRPALQVHVSRIRRQLTDMGVGDVLRTQAGGYVLQVVPDAVDAHRFERLAGQARSALNAGEFAEALRRARRALGLWTGSALGGVGAAPFAEAVGTNLTARRLEVIELATDADLAGPHPGEMLAELEQLVADHPYRESGWERLARLLYRSGRQADALSRLSALRRILVDEMGLDPGPAIVALETAILNHDPRLAPGTDEVGSSTSATKRRSRLPPIRPLVGRDDLIDEVVELLTRTSPVTLVGPGGVGKTSVAAHVAARSAQRFADGAFFVELGGLDDGTLVAAMIGAALGMHAGEQGITDDDLVAVLDGLEILLVLDNCEHLIDHVADLVSVLGSVPAVTILSTSRERLDIAEEHVVAVDPLSPGEASTLFVQRARAAVRDFNVDGVDSDLIVQICGRIDCLPLGVELIAARMRSLTPSQVVAQLDDVSLLSAHRRGGAERQRTLEATVRWSYGLLDAASQSVLRRMTVFGGAAELDDIVAVCADDRSGLVDGRRVLDELDTLCTRSLVVVDRSAGTVRYRLLETVRAYCARRLIEHGEQAAVGARLVARFTEKAAAVRLVVDGPDPAPGLDLIERDAPNFRAAHRISLERNDLAGAELLLSAFGPLVMFASGALPDLREWMAQVEPQASHSSADRLDVLLAAMWAHGRPDSSTRAMAAEAAQLAHELRDVSAEYIAYGGHAHKLLEEDLTAAETLIRRAFALPTGQVPGAYEALLTSMLNVIFLRRGDHAASAALMSEAVACDTTRYGLHEPMLLFHAGRLAMETGDFHHAGEMYLAAERAAERVRSPHGLSFALFGRGRLAYRTGDLETARDLFGRTLQIDKVVDPREVWASHFNLALTCLGLGDLDQAAEHVEALRRGAGVLSREAYETAAGRLARAHGQDRIAERHLRTAIEMWAAIPHVEFVANTIEELARCRTSSADHAQLQHLVDELRAGHIDIERVLTTVRDTAS